MCGHLNDHDECPSSLQALHFGGSSLVHRLVWWLPPHLLHFMGVLQSSVLCVKCSHLLHGCGAAAGGRAGYTG
jgi:hypothetical protein